MVTDKGSLADRPRRARTGKSCRSLPAPALRVYFTDEKNGWAACAKKTRVGRRTMAAQVGAHRRRPPSLPGAADRSASTAGSPSRRRNYGIVIGFNQPATRWGIAIPGLDGSGRCDEPPRDSAPLLHAGDARWRQDLEAGSASLFGHVTRARFSGQGSRPGADRVRRLVPLSRARSTKSTGRPGRARRSFATSGSRSPMSG